MVKIRLAQAGKKNQLTRHLVVIEAKKFRDGKVIEILGTPEKYDQIRLVYWQQKGAQLTPAVKQIVSQNG